MVFSIVGPSERMLSIIASMNERASCLMQPLHVRGHGVAAHALADSLGDLDEKSTIARWISGELVTATSFC